MLLLLLALACSDYGFVSEGPPDVHVGEPVARVTPDRVALEVCVSAEVTAAISNQGDADLTVTRVEIDGPGWVVAPPALPLVLPPGGSVDVLLTGTAGAAELVVGSDDPLQPELRIPLEATPDAPPIAAIVSPGSGEVLPPGGVIPLRANVWDETDPAETLGVSWRSSVDGLLSTASATPGGDAVHDWADPRAPGPHTLTLDVTDACGNTASDSVAVCQQAGYLADELDIDSWHFEGAARWDTANRWLELTTADPGLVGTAFQTGSTVSGDDVTIRFSFYIGDGTGADGISLTALDTTRMTTFLGGTGCGIGYGGSADCTAGPPLPGWTIEVDTYYNAGQDPTELDHVMFTFDGHVGAPAAWAPLPEMEDTGWHTMVVYVSAPYVRVAIDGVTYIDQELPGHFAFPAYVGFTAGTGGSTNRHLIEALEVTEWVCE